ncbi:DUF3079 domain-containing protein [Crenobacter sp. SG2305]|nr:DUF3079 domain-containing protein [Crenobacter sp. SG2305]MDN0081320.1 DUF3079 domain-containing protein [Crenobacter sp. SG2305]
MTKAPKIPLHPRYPERICWGSADALRCGSGSERTPHPVELFGDDWLDWQNGAVDAVPAKPERDSGG